MVRRGYKESGWNQIGEGLARGSEHDKTVIQMIR